MPRAKKFCDRAQALGWATTLFVFSSAAAADWPVARHDPRRTGAAPGTSELTNPRVYWRLYLGGEVREDGVLIHDVDGDAKAELLFASGGRLTAARPAGDPIWRSPLLGIERVAGVADLDGDGADEVVAVAPDRAFVLSVKTGEVLWSEPEGEMGSIAVVRVADLTGDALPDLLIQEHGCANQSNGNTGVLYSFSGGFEPAAPAATLPWITCGEMVTTVLDADGDGTNEVAVTSPGLMGLTLLAGATLEPIAATPSFSDWVSLAACVAADVDGAMGQELVCRQNYPTYGGERQVYAIRYAPETASLEVMWNHVIGDPVGGDLEMTADSVNDLDGDGAIEVVVSGATAAEGWTTRIYDATTGVEVAALPGLRFAGVAALGPAGELQVLGMRGTTLEGRAFSAAASPPTTLRWSLPKHEAVRRRDAVAAGTASVDRRLLAPDLDANGTRELVTTAHEPDPRLVAYSVGAAPPEAMGEYPLPDALEVAAAWSGTVLPGGGEQVVLARSDGYLVVLDPKMLPTNATSGPTGSPGLAFGGYFARPPWTLGASPVIGSLDDGAAAILVPDSRGSLLRLDARDASLASPPRVVWSRARTRSPSLVAGLDGAAPGIACVARRAPLAEPPFEVVALRADGSTLWQTPLAEEPYHDALPGDLDGDAVPDLVVQAYDADVSVHTHALSGATGAPLWSLPGVPMLGGLRPFALFDWNGDSRTDVLTVLGDLRALSGVDGATLTLGGSYPYFAPIVHDVDGDGEHEVTLQQGNLPARTLRHDLVTPVWIGTEDDRPFLFGAIARCGDAPPLLVEGSLAFPSRLKLTTTGGPSAGAFQTVVLAGGVRFDGEGAAEAAGATLGQLGNVSVHEDLTGMGRPTAVVGSTDGYLYGVDPCSGTLDFAVSFGAPVGEAVFGDSDGDGVDEILVTVADGYLHAIKHEPIPPPDPVLDVHPVQGGLVDIDSLVTGDALAARWTSVEGATSYEVSVLAEGGGLISAGPWIDVGLATETTLTGLPLEAGRVYFFAVRTVGLGGRSSDALSDGVLALSPEGGTDGGADEASPGAPPPVPEVDTGCGCRAVATGRGGGGASLLLLAALARRRRRTRTPLRPQPLDAPRAPR